MSKFGFIGGLYIIICLLCFPVKAQISADFENGDLAKWRQFPAAHWRISSEQAISGKKSLWQWSDSAVPTEDRISLSLAGLAADMDTVTYRFRIRHGSNPSLSNRWAVYLGYDEDASEMHPGGKGSGYMLGVNMNSSDDIIKLFNVGLGSFHEILATKFNWETYVGSMHPAGIEVKRYPSGQWNICIDKGGSFDSLQFFGSVLSNEITQFLNFGIYYDYTPTRNGMLWFDDLSIDGRFVEDTIAPSVKTLTAINDSSLAISFSENMDFSKPGLKSKFILKEKELIPDSVIIIRKDSIILRFNLAFHNESVLHLIVEDLADLSSNLMQADTLAFYFSPVKLNDVCINEIMPDPSPAIHLPEFEYIELYNRTNSPISLNGWTLAIGDENKTLPGFILNSREYLILCQLLALNSFKSFGNALGIFSAGSFLSNSGTCLQLKSADGIIISQVCYSNDWIEDPNKKDGGWSLEKVDPDIPCSGKENWTVSKDRTGGTPGRQNSINKSVGDHNLPKITSVFPDTDSTLIVSFNEVIGLNYPINPGAFKTDHEIGSPKSCSVSVPDYAKLSLCFNNHFQMDTVYSFVHDGSILDCAGNAAISEELKFELPALPDSQDVVFNEIMYHPISGCPEFIELYNRSRHVFNLADFRLALRDLFSDELKSLSVNIQEKKLFFPGEYIALTANADQLTSCYPQAKGKSITLFNGMPALTDDGQKLQLIARDLTVIDEMKYKDAMQFALIANTIGVSLEKIDYNHSSKDPSNWHSASSTSGFCTPGAENSQYHEAENSDLILKADPEIFSPNNDGINDVLSISYCFDQPGFVGNLIIFDAKGRQVKRLANNELLACKGQFCWDGSNERGAVVVPGIYIIWLEVFNLAGKTETYKKTCVVSRTR